jgi:hypothetical protein
VGFFFDYRVLLLDDGVPVFAGGTSLSAARGEVVVPLPLLLDVPLLLFELVPVPVVELPVLGTARFAEFRSPHPIRESPSSAIAQTHLNFIPCSFDKFFSVPRRYLKHAVRHRGSRSTFVLSGVVEILV